MKETPNNQKLVLSIDCGTQSIRALVFDQQGHLLAKVKEEFEPYISTKPGYAEQDPYVYWNNCIKCVQGLQEQHKELMENVVALCVTTMRNTGVCLDDKGRVIKPALLWLDQREASVSKKLSWYYRIAFKIIGMDKPIEMSRKQCKANWIVEHEPDTWDQTAKYVQLSGFFHYMLTGKIVDSIGSQVAQVPFNYKTQKWVKSKKAYQYEVFNIDKSRLSKLVKPGIDIGPITKEVSELFGFDHEVSVIAGASDKGCETLGVGCLDTSKASISFGTTATIQTTSDKYVEPIKFLPSYPAAIPNKFNPEIQVFRGYWMIRWFKQEFASKERRLAKQLGITPEAILDKELSKISPGADGLLLQPYWKPDLKNPEAKGSIIGFNDVHTRAHIYRAIIEGINYSLYEGLERIQRVTKTKIDKIYVSGGGSSSDSICQITADMFGLSVVRGETYESSGLGAAITGYVSLGIYSSYEEAIQEMVRETDFFEPDMKTHEKYDKIYHLVYKKIYQRLKKLYKIMDQL